MKPQVAVFLIIKPQELHTQPQDGLKVGTTLSGPILVENALKKKIMEYLKKSWNLPQIACFSLKFPLICLKNA